MLRTLAVYGYRSLQDFCLKLGEITLITGPNGSGKSNVYRSLRLLADAAIGRLVSSLAQEGGLDSVLWAGPRKPGHHKDPVALRLGFVSDEFTYSIDLGLPTPSESAFSLDPEIKRECVWRGQSMRPSTLWADRNNGLVKIRDSNAEWHEVETNLQKNTSILTAFADPERSLDLILLRDSIRAWRFYDHFRVDMQSPIRQPQVGTYAPVLSDDGSSLAATLQTIVEIGNRQDVNDAISDAFPGSELTIQHHRGRFELHLRSAGYNRSFSAAELSDGTLRYLLLLAALFSPRPTELVVFNEPESSLHPDLLPPLARAFIACRAKQLIIVTHSEVLAKIVAADPRTRHVQLIKSPATEAANIELADIPPWKWPAR